MKWQDIREGFERPFWVANLSEVFERLSYYAAYSSLAIYLHDNLRFSNQDTGDLTGLFGLVWFLAVFGGAVADRLGFRRALSLAYLILTTAYFLLGSIGASWMAPARNAMPLKTLVMIIVILPAFGVAMVKPCVVGTTARASKENVRSIGYSIYYTLVNVGSASGPYIASMVHQRVSVENVFRIAALSVLLMFFAVLLFFREPRRSGDAPPPSVAQTARNFLTVLGNFRFVLFLLIFSGFWVVYWQQFQALPLYLTQYAGMPGPQVELILITDALTVICLQIATSFLTKGIPPFAAITIGTLISSLSWLVLLTGRGVATVVLSLIVLAIGEMVLSPRYYEYVSRLAPKEQQGTYMGFAFVPIGVGQVVGGILSGRLMHRFAEVQHRPALVWWFFVAFGVGISALLWIYDVVVKPGKQQKILAAEERG
jgi:proton-dependent oligopeptide transporter, POT family